jgi:hypothetical protein
MDSVKRNDGYWENKLMEHNGANKKNAKILTRPWHLSCRAVGRLLTKADKTKSIMFVLVVLSDEYMTHCFKFAT